MNTPAILRLTREFEFEMAHALEGYDGACRQIHGHSYKLFITVSGHPISDTADPKLGMIMDFGELKSMVNNLIIDRFDHALLLRETPSAQELVRAMQKKWDKIEVTPYQPTCENLLLFIVTQIQSALPNHIKLQEVKLYETARSHATWCAEDN